MRTVGGVKGTRHPVERDPERYKVLIELPLGVDLRAEDILRMKAVQDAVEPILGGAPQVRISTFGTPVNTGHAGV